MLRRRVSVLVSVTLILVMAGTFLTGFVAAALDINRFAYHKYAAYVAVALALTHVVLHWRTLVGQVRRWILGSRAPSSPPTGAATTRRAADQPTALPGRPTTAVSVPPRLSRRTILKPGGLLGAGLGVGAALGQWWSSRGTALALEEGTDLGQVYHRWSVPTYAGLLAKAIHFRPQPSPYKTYPAAPGMPLPPVPEPGGPPLEAAIARRRSIREYADRSLTANELSRLLHYSAGITDRRDPTLAFRAAPSSGALFPIDVYPILFNVEGVAAGVYHYDVWGHRLELLRGGDFRREVFDAAISQEMIGRASLVLALTGLFDRVQFKYVDRSYRYLMLEAGHLGQNVYLTATALGLGPCGIGAFLDDDLNRLLGVDGHNEAVVYLLAVGPTSA